MIDLRDRRQAALRSLLEACGLQALLVSHLPNIRYLTGFTGSSGAAVVLPDEVVLVTDFRYDVQAADEVGAAGRVEIVASDVWERVGKELADAPGVETAGFEAHVVSVESSERFTDGWQPRIAPARPLVERLRATKHAVEVAAIREAATLAAAAFESTIGVIRAGVTEREIAAELERALRRAGSEWHPFPTIVASGPRTALPHARTSDRTVRRGDLVLLDFGAQLDGYCADLTRMVVAGRADDRQRTVHALVQDAQLHAREHIRSGMTGAEADGLARSLIDGRGFADAFGHSLGHGLGLEVHEAPRVSRMNPHPLPADAVVTIEPGIYFPGWGGVRLEDDIHLSAQGPVLLSDGQIHLRELT